MKLFFLCTILISGSLFAGEATIILEDTVARASRLARVSAKFFMDTQTGEGSAVVKVTDQVYDDYNRYPRRRHCDRFGCHPNPLPPVPRVFTIYDQKVRLSNLRLEGKQMIYSSNGVEINCGYLGRSRVFGAPTLYLNGKCKLKGVIRANNLSVSLIIK